MEPPNNSFFSITINFFQSIFHFTISSLSSCILMVLLEIESDKLHRRIPSSNLIFVRQIIGCDVSITVAVFDYVHWKLPIASFLLKSLFSFFKRRRSVRPRKILFTISTYASCQYFFQSSDNFTPTPSFMDANTFNKELIRAFILQFYVQCFFL